MGSSMPMDFDQVVAKLTTSDVTGLLAWGWPVHGTPDEAAPYPDSDKTGLGGFLMAWIVLIVSGIFEAVWATALSKTDGFTRLAPSVVFGVAMVISMAGLAYAMRTLPPGTSYAVWVGIGATLTIGYAMMTGAESASVIKVLLMLGIIGCIIGLKAVTH